MKKIILNEKKEQTLFQNLINEAKYLDKVSIVKDFLDKNFKRADITDFDEKGMIHSNKIVVWVDMHDNPIKSMTDVQLFYLLQEKYKNIFANKTERDTFLKKLIKAWYNKKISKYGTIIEH